MFIVKLLEAFNWRFVGIISDMTEVHVSIANLLFTQLRKQNSKVIYYKTQTIDNQGHLDIDALAQIKNMMKSLKKKVRVIICFLHDTDFELIVQLAHNEGMLKGFIFLTFGYQNPLSSEIFNGILFMDVTVPNFNEAWDKFKQQVIKGFTDPQFKEMPGLSQQASTTEVSLYAGEYFFFKI